MSEKIFEKKVFWRDFCQEYFDLTHLHGFKELSLSASKAEKVLWMIIIIGAFAFTGFLIYKSVKDSLDDKKQTSVDYKKYGYISLPVLYCPKDWIDGRKVDDANIPQNYVHYLLSYLRPHRTLYIDETFLLSSKGINGRGSQFCNRSNNDNSEFPALVLLAPYIETKCLYPFSIPNYYGNFSRELIKIIKVVMDVVDTSDTISMKRIFVACQKNDSKEIWKIIYHDLHLSVLAGHVLINYRTDSQLNEIGKTILGCGRSTNGILLTLNNLDKWINEGNLKCISSSTSPRKNNFSSDSNETDLCSTYNDAIIFYMFHSDCIKNYIFWKEDQDLITLEDKTLEIISKYQNYSKYLEQYENTSTYEIFRAYIKNGIGGSFFNQYVALTEIRKWAENEFKKTEKVNFEKFMTDRKLNIHKFLKTIAFDENRFLLSMSIDNAYEIRPKSGNISIEKVVNAYGVCYLFNITADMNPVTTILPTGINDLNQLRKLNENLYVRIIQFNTEFSYLSSKYNGNGVVVIGSEAKNLIPRQNTFELESVDVVPIDFHSFEVSNLAYQKKQIGLCPKNTDFSNNVIYTQSDCFSNCFNIFYQPKYPEAVINRKSICHYIAESLTEVHQNEQCSFFSKNVIDQPGDSSEMYMQDGLDECISKCLPDCDSITFETKFRKTDCSESKDCIQLKRDNIVNRYDNEQLLHFDWYSNLPINGSAISPIWINPPDYNDHTSPTTFDMILNIVLMRGHAFKGYNRELVARLDIQINAAVTTYETSQSQEWYSYLGDVGGQINLVISGSLLTVFQLVWWCSQYFFRYHQMPIPATLRKEEFSFSTFTGCDVIRC